MFSYRKKQFARSLYIVKDVKKGEIFTNENVKAIRPGYGLRPKYLKDILGKKAKYDILRGEKMKWEFIE